MRLFQSHFCWICSYDMFDVFPCHCCFVFNVQKSHMISKWKRSTVNGWLRLKVTTHDVRRRLWLSNHKWILRWFSGKHASTMIHFFLFRKCFYLWKWIPGWCSSDSLCSEENMTPWNSRYRMMGSKNWCWTRDIIVHFGSRSRLPCELGTCLLGSSIVF